MDFEVSERMPGTYSKYASVDDKWKILIITQQE